MIYFKKCKLELINLKYENYQFDTIVRDILNNEEFCKMKNITHHGLNRYDHSLRVSYLSYNVSKALRLDYNKVARAALLHDFFLEDNKDFSIKGKVHTLVNHPKYALNNACNYFYLSDMEKDIILTHMFPVSLNVPKYVESWIVDIVDDCVSIYERLHGISKQLSFATSYMFILLLNYIR